MQGLAKIQQIMAAHATTAVPTALVPMKPYARNLPKCSMCNCHHKGSSREMHCKNCNMPLTFVWCQLNKTPNPLMVDWVRLVTDVGKSGISRGSAQKPITTRWRQGKSFNNGT